MRSRTSYQRGIWAEFVARMYLRFHGFRIVKSRYVTGRNTNRAEIDIIAKRRDLLVFVEVKSRQNLEKAFAAISRHQENRLRRAAETYIASVRWNKNARFDVIAVCGRKITWIRNVI